MELSQHGVDRSARVASVARLDSTTGAYLIGTLFEIWLFGFTSLQSWYYFQHYPADIKELKAMVIVIWCLECLHATFSSHATYFWLVTNYSNPPALNLSIWSAEISIILGGNLVFIVHCFFCYRVWEVSGRTYIVPCIIFILTLCSYGMDWALFVVSDKDKRFSAYGLDTTNFSTAGLSFKVTTDVIVACSLGYFLHKRKVGGRRTDYLANKLIFWAVNIGILTSIFNVLVLAWTVSTNNLISLAIYNVVGNLYSNSFLATLNIREYVRTQVLAENGTALSLETIRFSAVTTSLPRQGVTSRARSTVSVFQTTSVGPIPDIPKPTFRRDSSTNVTPVHDLVLRRTSPSLDTAVSGCDWVPETFKDYRTTV